MKEEITFTAKQVGERVKERRLELNLTMPELGKRIGVNKSTIQRYEADGVDPKRTMIINGLAEALLTTPEWLTGLSEEKEYDAKTLCQRDIESHIAKCLDSVSVVQGEPHQQLLTTFLGKMMSQSRLPRIERRYFIYGKRFCKKERQKVVLSLLYRR